MKIAISQPTYLPWLGYFDLIDQVDTFVLLDDVQFEKQSWQQRNRIKTPQGLHWLTVPVVFRGRLHQLIKDVQIRVPEFHEDHLRAMELNYRRAVFFQSYYENLATILSSAGPLLAELNIRLIEWGMTVLGIRTPLVRSSDLKQEGKKTELLAKICKALRASQYVSPMGAAVYLLGEKEALEKHGVEVVFQNYTHPEYSQLFPPFVPYACVADLLFNVGPDALGIIRSGRGAALHSEQVASVAEHPTG
jgi:hypothetical protein